MEDSILGERASYRERDRKKGEKEKDATTAARICDCSSWDYLQMHLEPYDTAWRGQKGLKM